MRQRSINIDSIKHPQPIPLACRVGPILATSGIMGRDSETKVMPEDVAGQVGNCFNNLKLVLAEADMDMGDVAKITFFVRDDGARDAINEVWLAHYPDPAHRPARHTQKAELRGAVLVQLDVLAVAKDFS
ncbi:MAG: RidA family protein [Sphingobium sp.]